MTPAETLRQPDDDLKQRPERLHMTAPKPYYTIKSLAKGLHILEHLGTHRVMGVAEIARALGESRSACSRFLATLRDLGYVAQDDTARYRLTLKAFSLGQQAAATLDIKALALPTMRKLVERFDETANLACLEADEVVVLEIIKGRAALKYDLPIGSRGPAHSTALGKAILAFSAKQDQEAFFESVHLTRITPNTLSTRRELAEEFETVRRRGYALDCEEWMVGISCVAVPLLDYAGAPRYALSLSGPTQRMTPEKIDRILEVLPSAARKLSSFLGAGDYGVPTAPGRP